MKVLALLLLLDLKGVVGIQEASIGEKVRLECRTRYRYIFWLKLGPEKLPQVFTESSSSGYLTDFNINVIKEKDKLILELKNVSENDSADYLCLYIHARSMKFLERVKLIVTGPSVHPATTPQSSTPEPESWTCFPPERFLRPPSFVYAEGVQEYDCVGEERKCTFNFFINVSLSNTTGLGLVASCGERTQQEETADVSDSMEHIKIHLAMGVILMLSLTCNLVLLLYNKRLKNQPNSGTSGTQNNSVHEGPSVIYVSNLRFQRSADRTGTQETNPQEDQCVYATVKKHRFRKHPHMVQ